MPRATKIQVMGRRKGRPQVYQRWTIEGHGNKLFSYRLQTGRNQPPYGDDVHALYHTKAGDRTASFYPEAVPDD